MTGRCQVAALTTLEHHKGDQYQHADQQWLSGRWQLLAASGAIALSLPVGQALCEASRVRLAILHSYGYSAIFRKVLPSLQLQFLLPAVSQSET
jgi:hypothetical protein